MAASGSSSSSFASSSLSYPSSYAHTYTSPIDTTWTPTSTVSAATSVSSVPTPLRPLDLGPPGYQATIVLFERTPNERTVYLGPWELTSGDVRRITWQCSYQGEVLEHYLPTTYPPNIYPHTLHARHRPYGDPCDMELFLAFREPHRIRYVTNGGGVIHDEYIEVKYEFTTLEGSHRFQGDLRHQDLVDHFDVDVVWSDREGRTDTFGSVRGIGAIQRMKMWRDRFTTCHHITFYANRTDRRYREYPVFSFDSELKHRDDGHRRLRLAVRGRRGSAQDGDSGSSSTSAGRRFSIPSLRRGSRGDSGHGGGGGNSSSSRSTNSRSGPTSSSSASVSAGTAAEIRYLGLQFSRPEDYTRFVQQWARAHANDSNLGGVSFPAGHFELPSPDIMAEMRPIELDGSSRVSELDGSSRVSELDGGPLSMGPIEEEMPPPPRRW